MSEQAATLRATEKVESRVATPALWLSLVLILGLAVRGYLAAQPRVVWGDEPIYLWLAQNWLAGEGYQFLGFSAIHHGPGFPVLAGLLYLFTRDLLLSSSLVYILTGGLLVLPSYALASRIYGQEVGLLSALLVALYPALTLLLIWGTMTEPPYLLAIFTALYLGLVGVQENRRLHLALAGVLVGFAWLIRQEAMLYVLSIGGFALVYLTLTRRWDRTVLTGLVLLVLSFVTVAAVWSAYMYQQTGQFVVTAKAGMVYATTEGLAYGDTRIFDQATWQLDDTGLMVALYSDQHLGQESMFQAILADPRGFARLVYVNIQRFTDLLFGPRLLPGYLAALVVLGLLRTPWDRQRAWYELFLFLSAAPVLVYLLFFVQDRYLIPVMPILLIWLAVGLWEVGRWLRETLAAILPDERPRLQASGQRVARAAPILLAGLLVLMLTPDVLQASTRVRSFQPEHRAMGVWLREQGVTGDTTIMARYPAIAFHADARWVPTPAAAVEDVLHYADHHGVQIWVIDAWEADDLRPQFADIFYHPEEGAPESWAMMHLMPARDGDIVVLQRER